MVCAFHGKCIIILFLSFFLSSSYFSFFVERVALLGDSITQFHTDTSSIAIEVQNLLGSNYLVENFGRGKPRRRNKEEEKNNKIKRTATQTSWRHVSTEFDQVVMFS